MKGYHIAPTGNILDTLVTAAFFADFHLSLNVARLANIPQKVLDVAAVKSDALEDMTVRKKLAGLYIDHGPDERDEADLRRSGAVRCLSEKTDMETLERIITGIEQL